MKRLKDNSDAPEAMHGTLQKHIQAQGKRQGYILVDRRKMGTPGRLRQQKSWRKEFVLDSTAYSHMVSKRDHNYGELETMRKSRSPCEKSIVKLTCLATVKGLIIIYQ